MADDEFVGPVHEEFIQLSDETPAPPVVVNVGGVEMHRDVMSDMRGFRATGDKEYTSEALAVHPDEIGAMTADSRKHGVEPKRYEADGSPVFSSARHKKAYMKVYGYHANNSYD